MEFAARRFSSDLVHRVSKRVRSLSESFARKEWSCISNRILAPILLAFGLFCSAWAYHLSGEDALEGWLKGHLPTPTVWTAALAPSKFQRVSDPKLLQKIYRSIPSSAEPVGSVWKSSEGAWVAVFAEPPQSFVLYRAEEAPQKISWQPVGRGWAALEQAIHTAEDYEKALEKRLKKPKAAGTSFDPLEIRY